MTTEQFEKMLTPELLAKLRRIAAGVVGIDKAEDAVQTALLRIFRRRREYRKITSSFLVSRVVMVCGEKHKTRASNASLEVPMGSIEDEQDGLAIAERKEREREYGRRTPPRDPERDWVGPPTDLEAREKETHAAFVGREPGK